MQFQEKKQAQQSAFKEFTSGNIKWKMKSNFGLYPEWHGFYNEVHMFTMTQRSTGYEVSIVTSNSFSTSILDAQKKAESLLEYIQGKNNQPIIENRFYVEKPFNISHLQKHDTFLGNNKDAFWYQFCCDRSLTEEERRKLLNKLNGK